MKYKISQYAKRYGVSTRTVLITARLYGMRRNKRRTEKIIKEIGKQNETG